MFGDIIQRSVAQAYSNVQKYRKQYIYDWETNWEQWRNYFTMLFAPNLVEVTMEIHDLAKSLDLPLQIFEVTTPDGYIIEVHRLVGKGSAVLLMHGMMVNSMCWLSSGEESLGYQLHKAGFDVWLGNVRGGRFGSNHTSLSTKDPQFWRYTFHEIGTQDIPAILEKIVTETGCGSVDCIGHSMGATALLIANSASKRAQARIGQTVLLAPVALVSEKQIGLPSNKHVKRIQQEVANWLGVHYLLLQIPGMDMIKKRPLFPVISDTIVKQFVGGSGSTLKENLSVDLISNSSIYNILHFMQIMSEKKFRPFDWNQNSDEEIKEYDLSKVTSKTTLFFAKSDYFVPTSLESDYRKVMPALIESRVVDMTHIGFLWGGEANTLVYQPIIQTLSVKNE